MIALALPTLRLAAALDELRLSVPPGVELELRLARVAVCQGVRRWLA